MHDFVINCVVNYELGNMKQTNTNYMPIVSAYLQ